MKNGGEDGEGKMVNKKGEKRRVRESERKRDLLQMGLIISNLICYQSKHRKKLKYQNKLNLGTRASIQNKKESGKRESSV